MSDDRTRYETHEWDPTEDDQECIVCGVTWSDCDDVCPGLATGGLIGAGVLSPIESPSPYVITRAAFDALMAAPSFRPHERLLHPLCGIYGQHPNCHSAICECECHIPTDGEARDADS